MKTIGLLGGMSWESTALYYRVINEKVKETLGGLHSAHIVMVSVDFQEIEDLQHRGLWEKSGEVLGLAAKQLEAAGADFLVICTNTMHKVAHQIESAVQIPLLHIADATAEAVKDRGIETIGLLGTRFTMEQDFYAGRLREKHGLTVLIPDEADRTIVHNVIYDELVLGKVKDKSRSEFLRIMEAMKIAGAGGVILGCTEIGMLVGQTQTDIPLFDTALIHASKTVEMALDSANS